MLSQEQRELLDLATETYAASLDLAMPYLEKRGVSPQCALSRGLGFVAEPVVGHQSFKGRLAIPYVTQAGTVNMTFRCIKDHDCKLQANHHKYLKPKGLEATLYGVADIFKDTLDIGLVEGEIDTFIMSDMVGFPAVGVPGAEHWKPWWTDILKDFRRVFVFMDGDKAGQDLGERAQKELGMSAVLISYEDKMDTNSTYLEYGAQHILEMIK
jgi:DNA primase